LKIHVRNLTAAGENFINALVLAYRKNYPRLREDIACVDMPMCHPAETAMFLRQVYLTLRFPHEDGDPDNSHFAGDVGGAIRVRFQFDSCLDPRLREDIACVDMQMCNPLTSLFLRTKMQFPSWFDPC